jgi:hypothetical protein
MRKTQLTYGVMILVFSLGLWGILRLGSRLHAAPDVAGEWTLSWDGAGAALPQRMIVNQSGKFVNVVLTRADLQSSVKFRGTLQQTGSPRTELALKAVNDPLTMNGVYDPASRTLSGTAEGSGRWRAIRVQSASNR